MGLQRVFQAEAYGDLPIAENFWHACVSGVAQHTELVDEQVCDTAIVGGGYTGLSAALTLSKRGVDVALVEANRIGWGASGRNGGFCCLGGAFADDDSLIRRYGMEDAKRYFHAERAAVDLVADLLDLHGIDADVTSNGETILAHKARRLDGLKDTADEIDNRYGVSCEFHDSEELKALGMHASGVAGGLTIPIGFALHPFKYASGLASACVVQGARLFEQSPILQISSGADGLFILKSRFGQLKARKVLLATNGYSADNLPEWLAGRYMPAQSNILLSRVLTTEEISRQGWSSHQMAYDTRTLLHYFRLLPDNRFLFGMRGSVSAEERASQSMRKVVRRDFEWLFPEWTEVETPDFWSGLVCLTRGLVPFVGNVPGFDGLYAAYGYHGNGVAMGTYAGRLIASEILGEPSELVYPDLMKAAPARYPVISGRRYLLSLSYAWYGLKDRLL